MADVSDGDLEVAVSGGYAEVDGKYYAMLIFHQEGGKRMVNGPHDTLEGALEALDGFRAMLAILDPEGKFVSKGEASA